METPFQHAADLQILTSALFDPADSASTDLAHTALVFAADTCLAVPSFAGLSITVTQHLDHGVERVVLRLTLLEGQVAASDVTTSLLLPGLAGAAGQGQPRVQIVLYAATPGAFVDLAADIAFLTGHDFDPAVVDQHQGLAGEPDITGVLQAETVISEAIGVLLDNGRTPDQAYAELDTLALAADTDRTTEATGILAALAPVL